MEYKGNDEKGNYKSLHAFKDKGQWQCNYKQKKKHKFLTFIPVTIYQACCIRQRVREGIFFFIFVLFILILVALYQVGSRLRSRHVEFISEFYRWLAAEKFLVGGQWATSYDTNENFADLPNQAFMDHRANLIIRNPNKIRRKINM